MLMFDRSIDVTRLPSQPIWSHGLGEHGSSSHLRSKPVNC
uniref:Uncharacterized protein n=1 Tax=Rhizophora mucronata TaxID=61149 RepID=A0A2P2J2Y6_RHIMU